MVFENIELPKGRYLIEKVFRDTEFGSGKERNDTETGLPLYRMVCAVVPEGYRKPERIVVRIPHKQDLTTLPYGTVFSGFQGLSARMYALEGEETLGRVSLRAKRLVRSKTDE